MYRLHYGIQNYEWGKLGKDSTILKSLQKANDQTKYPEDKPYAELWMGDHPTKPSTIELSNQSGSKSLIDFIKQDPSKSLGVSYEKFKEAKLPFLFKMLNVAKSLSIQAHPDKKLAESLYNNFPDIYKDPNHKPEMALAITDFHALCNFLPFNEIKEVFETYKPFTKIFNSSTIEGFLKSENEEEARLYLKQIIKEMFDKDNESIKATIREIIDQIEKKSIKADKDNLLLTLQNQYPDDIGILFALLMNYLILKPGDALVLEANEPHAYLFGDCMECMASSDNVVRCGLTPKLKDKETLYKMLTYKMFKTKVNNGKILYNLDKCGYEIKVYDTNYSEFFMMKITIPKSNKQTLELTYSTPSIAFIYSGYGFISYTTKEEKGKEIKISCGQCYFIMPNTCFNIKTNEIKEGEEQLIVFICSSQNL